MIDHVVVVPEVVLAAATELELLADRLAAAQATGGALTHIAAPSGSEEVSVLAANHFNQVAAAHEHAVGQGVVELRHAAQTLRTHVANYREQDAAHAATLGGIRIQ